MPSDIYNVEQLGAWVPTLWMSLLPKFFRNEISLKMEAVRSQETSAGLLSYKTTRRHISEDSTLNTQKRKHTKSHKKRYTIETRGKCVDGTTKLLLKLRK